MPIKSENRHFYTGGWKQTCIKILQRAQNKCELCGVDNYQIHPITGAKVILTIMHLDHNPQNMDETNLKAGCQRCHNRYDVEHRKETRKKTRIEKKKDLTLNLL